MLGALQSTKGWGRLGKLYKANRWGVAARSRALYKKVKPAPAGAGAGKGAKRALKATIHKANVAGWLQGWSATNRLGCYKNHPPR